MTAGRMPWNMDMALSSRPYIQEHVLDYNAARGWTFDTFMHTWQPHFEEQLVELLQPTVHSSGPQLLRGAHLAQQFPLGMISSIDIVVSQMLAHNVTYDRVLVLRYDAVFYMGLDLSSMDDDEAFYVASWCKPIFSEPLPTLPGTAGCWPTRMYWADLEGVPDFWFAGAPSAVAAVFERIEERIHSGAIHIGRTCNGCNHAQIWGAVQASGVPLRRLGYHQIHNDLFRDHACGIKWHTSPLDQVPWMNFTWTASTTADSMCEGGVLCAVAPAELLACGAFGLEPPPDWARAALSSRVI